MKNKPIKKINFLICITFNFRQKFLKVLLILIYTIYYWRKILYHSLFLKIFISQIISYMPSISSAINHSNKCAWQNEKPIKKNLSCQIISVSHAINFIYTLLLISKTVYDLEDNVEDHYLFISEQRKLKKKVTVVYWNVTKTYNYQFFQV